MGPYRQSLNTLKTLLAAGLPGDQGVSMYQDIQNQKAQAMVARQQAEMEAAQELGATAFTSAIGDADNPPLTLEQLVPRIQAQAAFSGMPVPKQVLGGLRSLYPNGEKLSPFAAPLSWDDDDRTNIATQVRTLQSQGFDRNKAREEITKLMTGQHGEAYFTIKPAVDQFINQLWETPSIGTGYV